ncbi:hypothetical protein SAMN05444858_1494 [Micromonospora avicenniae]|uniref:Uncharacterized protein n=1 Tax=Micromonospora avicenniae TaxID=1198245 RepID=A0A1N7FUG3_9ACTN|nr:hypothetical protein SAMN05444858_1494 [Micromonospora avicenniae]
MLAGRELRADIAVESTARFGDLVWDLMPALVQKHQRRMKLDFTTLPQRYRVAWFTGHVATRLRLGAFSDVAKNGER